jgi:hypothetical protein
MDPDPDPAPDPSIIKQKLQEKLLFCDFFLTFYLLNKQKNLLQKLIFCWRLEGKWRK